MRELRFLVFSLAVSPLVIAHGVVLDLDWSAWSRVSLGGWIVTSVVTDLVLNTLYWLFGEEDDEGDCCGGCRE